VHYWLKHFDVKVDKADKAKIEAEALRWALQRGSRSGRVAWQFARDYAGKHTA